MPSTELASGDLKQLFAIRQHGFLGKELNMTVGEAVVGTLLAMKIVDKRTARPQAHGIDHRIFFAPNVSIQNGLGWRSNDRYFLGFQVGHYAIPMDKAVQAIAADRAICGVALHGVGVAAEKGV